VELVALAVTFAGGRVAEYAKERKQIREKNIISKPYYMASSFSGQG